jgi:hypothetical protein
MSTGTLPEIGQLTMVSMDVDLDATVRCMIEGCQAKAVWRGVIRHEADGVACEQAVLCSPHKVQVDARNAAEVARIQFLAMLFRRGVATLCQPHSLPARDVDWTFL